MRLIWIIAFLGCAVPRYIKDHSARRWIQTLSVPWVGILSFKQTIKSREAVAGMSLISTKVGMASAREVATIDKRYMRITTTAMFLTLDGHVRYSSVADYFLHPEFDEDTLNTLALLKLDYDEKQFQWQLMQWPKEWAQMNEHEGDVYVLGYTDRHQALEQIMHKMEFVNMSDCYSFYKNEGLDSKWMAPTKYQCFRQMYNSEPCVFDSGMVLAAFSKGKWTLLGMSILGPGCSLPARFIDFARYLPWVQVTTKPTRRRDYVHESQYEFPNYDKILMEKLNDSSIVMRPYNKTEVIYGKCEPSIEGDQVYREEGSFRTPGKGVAIYALTIWDRLYKQLTCAMLTIECEKRSKDPFSLNFGLVQYDWDLDAFTKSVPWTKDVQSKYVHIQTMPWDKWWNRPAAIHGRTPESVIFKFEFYKNATISIVFYGK